MKALRLCPFLFVAYGHESSLPTQEDTMPKQPEWLAGEVIVAGVHHLAVYEPRPGTRVKVIAQCGRAGAPDEQESLANARLFSQAPQMAQALHQMTSALRELENRFTALEAAYFTSRGEQVPPNETGV
jgi:hypothetical protein